MKIKENKRKREVILLDKFKIGGVLLEERCSVCNYKLIYFDKYDCNFCPNCNEWDTDMCGDADCIYCKNRPATPLSEFY